ncbi:uncharacterized protein [Branchiostoma lanceolatum]|uniref:uncharacterized protein n=1 Tax=Branchiostoma lanceolatum TaxID=7740 RepID=UPI0034546FD5
MNIRVLVTVGLLVLTPTEGGKTEFCRNNPKSLSCQLAEADPDRAYSLYQENQWAFQSEEPEVAKGVWLTQNPSWVLYATGISGRKGAAEALDGDTRTYWNPWGVRQHHNNWYLILDLTTPHTLTGIAVNNFGDITHDIAAFRFQKSQDGIPYNWEDVKSVGNVQVGTNRRQEFGGFQATAQYWRFLVTRTPKGFQPWLRELSFFGISSANLRQKRAPSRPFVTHSACNIRRQWRGLNTLYNMEAFSLQAYNREKYQGYNHVECIESDPVINCDGKCETKTSKINFVRIYYANGNYRVRTEWFPYRVPTGCELEVKTYLK